LDLTFGSQLEKVKLALQKKVREIQTITDDLTQEKAKFERLLAATKSLKIENNRLQQEGASRSSGFLSNQNATKELDEAIERNEKLEAALKKLKQMVRSYFQPQFQTRPLVVVDSSQPATKTPARFWRPQVPGFGCPR
jgi:predicted nuclease with TOPRIM domain